jgi:oxygen-dependent protoporphyrinogen oxidase
VIAVIGGGISGLSSAYFLRKGLPEARIMLFESRARLGGNILTDREDGLVLDAGPDSFLRTKPSALELCRELGLEDEIVTTRPEARAVYFARAGRLEAVPEGMVLGVPTRVRSVLDARFMSVPGKLRMLAELLLPAGFGSKAQPAGADESIASFVSRRFGAEAASGLGTPLLAGIYAGDAHELSMHATFPHLPALERRYGSVIRGLIQPQLALDERSRSASLPARLREARAWLRKPPGRAGESPFLSLRHGMGTLVDALTATLDHRELRLRAEPGAIEIGNRGVRWSFVANGEQVHADAIVLAVPAHAAARLVPCQALAGELAGIRYASTATAFFAVPQTSLRRSLDGSGFIVPPGEGGVLAGTWVSSKWPGRAPAGTALVRAFLGGVNSDVDVSRESDEALLAIAHFELSRLMGPLGRPSLTRVYRHLAANPQPTVGHTARVARIMRAREALPGLHLVGAGYDGVSIADCVRQARTVADAVVKELPTK